MTGEVKAGNKDVILKSSAIGSCIVITAYDKINKVGAMAHIMLPEKSPENKDSQKTRYAFNAIDELMNILTKFGAEESNVESCIVGGANILQSENDIGQDNISSVEKILREKQILVTARSLGGIERRSITLDVRTGLLMCSIGDESENILWKFATKT